MSKTKPMTANDVRAHINELLGDTKIYATEREQIDLYERVLRSIADDHRNPPTTRATAEAALEL